MSDKDYYTNILHVLKIDLERSNNNTDKLYLQEFIKETENRKKTTLFD